MSLMSDEVSARPAGASLSLNGSQPPTDWTAPEKELWCRYQEGKELDLSDPDPTRNDPVDGGAWDEDRQLRASVVSHLLLNPPDQNPGKTPRFIVNGARITGRLDLGCGNAISFLFNRCRFDNVPNLNDMTASFVGFSYCHLPGLSAARIACSGPVWLQGSHLNGIINFEEAKVRGEFDLDRIKYDGPKGVQHSICLCGATIGGNLTFQNSVISGNIGLSGATITGNLFANDAEISCSKTAVFARQTNIAGTFRAVGHFKCAGEISMEGAHIAGELIMTGITVAVSRSVTALQPSVVLILMARLDVVTPFRSAGVQRASAARRAE